MSKKVKISLLIIVIIAIIAFRYEIKYSYLELVRYKSKSPGVEDKLKELHPLLRYRISIVIRQAEKEGLIVKVTSGHRPEEYNASIGGAKYSHHIWRSGVDLNIGDLRMASSKSKWKKWADLGKSVGLRWGGDFAGNYDPVHFDLGNEYKVIEIDKGDRLIFGKYVKAA